MGAKLSTWTLKAVSDTSQLTLQVVQASIDRLCVWVMFPECYVTWYCLQYLSRDSEKAVDPNL